MYGARIQNKAHGFDARLWRAASDNKPRSPRAQLLHGALGAPCTCPLRTACAWRARRATRTHPSNDAPLDAPCTCPLRTACAWRARRATRTHPSNDAPLGGAQPIMNQAGRRFAPPITACILYHDITTTASSIVYYRSNENDQP